jgi:hypothetical protein
VEDSDEPVESVLAVSDFAGSLFDASELSFDSFESFESFEPDPFELSVEDFFA